MTIKAREEEYNKIKKVIKNFKEEKRSAVLYLCGVPGSGKTYTITKIIDSIQNVYINCNNLKRKTSIYKKIMNNLKCAKNKIKTFLGLLKHLQECKKDHIIILDEIDLLITKSQSILYNLYSLPSYENVNLLLITISNSFNLDLDSKIISRIGNNKISFAPYKSDQLMEILDETVSIPKSKKNNGLSAKEFIARRVGAVSGDARKAIRLFKSCKNYKIEEIEKKIKEKYNFLLNNYLLSLTLYPKIFFICNVNKLNILEAFEKFNDFCRLKSIEEVKFTDFNVLLHRLSDEGMIVIKKQQIQVFYLIEEILAILKNDLIYKKYK